jgi:tRNA(Ile)-lysidine synthase
LALGVSGGGDSVALMHLAAAWAKATGIDPASIFVLTVDHGLRPEAAEEVAQVGAWARGLGFSQRVLTWAGGKPASGLQEKARNARRELMCGWCREHGIGDLLVGHTGDDQIETVGMRLVKASGTAGLGGMKDVGDGLYGVRICRPLLGEARESLRGWLRHRGQAWIEDPSNEDTSFERVQMRKALAGQDDAAADVARLADTALKGRAALDQAADLLLGDALQIHAAGWAELDLEVFASAPRSVGEHALSRALAALGGAAYPPNRQSLARIYGGLTAVTPSGGTLAGALIVAKSGKSALLGREERNILSQALTARQWQTWDHRFEIRSGWGARVRALAHGALDDFSGADRERVKAAVPAAFRGSLMVLEYEDGQLAVPHAGVGPAGDLEVIFRGLRPYGALRLGEPRKRV